MNFDSDELPDPNTPLYILARQPMIEPILSFAFVSSTLGGFPKDYEDQERLELYSPIFMLLNSVLLHLYFQL